MDRSRSRYFFMSLFSCILVNTEADLSAALEATSRKLSPTDCPTPLQELALIGISAEHRLGKKKKTPLSSIDKPFTDSLEGRFLSRVAELFSQRFGRLANVSYAPESCTIMFSIR